MKMGRPRIYWQIGLIVAIVCEWAGSQNDLLEMDRYSVCGKEFFVSDRDVTVMWPSKVAPSNPPPECIVFLTSSYSETNGRYKLQIIADSLKIKDCGVNLDLFNGRGAYGNYIRSLGCGSKSTDIMYSTGNQITVRLTRPSVLYETNNMFILKIRTYKDADDYGVVFGTLKLTIGGIIGIIIGIVALIVIAVLLGWCYKTGKLNYYAGRTTDDSTKDTVSKSDLTGINNDALTDKSGSAVSELDYRNPAMWNSITESQNTAKLGRNFYQQNATSRFTTRGQRAANGHQQYSNENQGYYQNTNQRRPSGNENGAYEKYEFQTENAAVNDAVKLNMARNGSTDGAVWSKNNNAALDRNDSKRSSAGKASQGQTDSKDVSENNNALRRDDGTRGSRGSQRSTGSNKANTKQENDEDAEEKEPLNRPPSGLFENPDAEGYLYDYDHVKALSDENIEPLRPDSDKQGYDAFVRDAPGGTRLRSSDRESLRGSKRDTEKIRASGTGDDLQTPEELGDQDLKSDDMMRHQPMDIQSEPESEQISNPNLINAAVRSTIPNKNESPSTKKRKKKGGKHGRQKSADQTPELPPEAFEPVFTTPISADPYQPASVPYGPYGAPGYGNNMYPPNQPYMPFGMMPMSAFVPSQGQTVAYAYQTIPQPGTAPPGQMQQVAGQAAWMMQSTPTSEGPVNKTAFMVVQGQTTPSETASRLGDSPGDLHNMGHPAYSSTPGTELTPKGRPKLFNHRPGGAGRPTDPIDLSVIAAGAVPPDPGPGHRSAVMKSGIDPKTGMQTTQVTWTDNIVDPSDPPGPNPQVTRKTITRVTARSGEGDLPEATSTIINQLSAPESDEPAFLSPSAIRPKHRAPRPITDQRTHDSGSVSYYTGQQIADPVVHDGPEKHRAFLNQIRMDETAA